MNLIDARFTFVKPLGICLTVVGLLAFGGPAVAQLAAVYDAGPAGGGPADINPVLQGWSESEVNDGSSVPADQNVFFLQPDGTTGFNATLIDDQHGGTPTDNPRYQIFILDQQFQNMYDHGWNLDFRFRPVAGGNFIGWGINPSSAADPGWGLGGRERVGFGVSIDTGDNSAVVSPIGGSPINLGPDSANDHHLVSAVGAPLSSTFELLIDGVSQGSLDISDGTSNSGSDNRIFWESGSSGGTGRTAAWNLVSLTAVPEPGTLLLAGLSVIGLLGIRRKWTH